MELTLDTSEDCFLCLQKIGSGEKNEQCLGNICRFLRINTSAVLQQVLKKEQQMDVSNLLQEVTKYNFSVNLCSPCSAIARKFSSLIHDLEVAHLQVNYYSEVFQRILEQADLTTAATRKSDLLVTEDARMVDHLREITKQQCSARNKKTLTTTKFPIVRIKRLHENITTTTTNKYTEPFATVDALASTTLLENLNQTGNNVGPTNLSTPHETSKMICDPQSDVRTGSVPNPKLSRDKSTAPRVNMKKILNHNLTMLCQSQVSGGHYKCPFCEVIIKNSKYAFVIHLTANHPEKLFSFAKRPDISEGIFTSLYHQVVLQESERCERLSTTNLNGTLVMPSRAHYVCYICRKTSTDSRYLRHHLVTCHTKVVINKLRCLQQDEKYWMPISERGNKQDIPALLDTLVINDECTVECSGQTTDEINTPNNCGSNEKEIIPRYACMHCTSTFTRSDEPRIHMLRWHPEQIFLSCKPSHKSLSEFADSCRKIFEREAKAYGNDRHKNSVARQCAYCTITRRYKIDYLNHLVTSHKDILTEKIKALENGIDDEDNKSFAVVDRDNQDYCWNTCSVEEPQDNMLDPLREDGDDGYEKMVEDTADFKGFPFLVESISVGESNSFGSAVD